MMSIRTALTSLAILSVAALSANAQVVQNRFQIVAHGGWHIYADGSGLTDGPTIGGDATYFFTPAIGIGLYTDITFTEADGEKFPVLELSFQDSSTFNVVNQPLDIWTYGAHVKLQLPGQRIGPFGLVGAGGYTVFLDPQQQDGNRNTSGFMVRLGAGVDFAVSEMVGFHISVMDAFYPNWDVKDRPERIYPATEIIEGSRRSGPTTRFPELNPDPNALSNSVHNFKFVAGVTLIPGG